MRKSHAQRQKEYRECLKEKNPENVPETRSRQKKNNIRSFEEN